MTGDSSCQTPDWTGASADWEVIDVFKEAISGLVCESDGESESEGTRVKTPVVLLKPVCSQTECPSVRVNKLDLVWQQPCFSSGLF